MKADRDRAARQLIRLFDDLLHHEGSGDLRVELRPLKRGQKEILVCCGRQYRYIVDAEAAVDPINRFARDLHP